MRRVLKSPGKKLVMTPKQKTKPLTIPEKKRL